MESLSSRFSVSTTENKDVSSGSATKAPPPSVFGIIVVGLLAGLVVGLLTGPNFTLQGFFVGFAGGALITAGLYFYSAERSQPAR
jgi:predicted lipid-binding transport protein (Tim44 family)